MTEGQTEYEKDGDITAGTPEHNLRADLAEQQETEQPEGISSVGKVAVSEPTNVPEAYKVEPKNWTEVHPGGNAREGEVDEIDESSPNIERSKDRAKIIAVTENEDRSEAAKTRRARAHLEFYPDRAGEIEADKAKLGREPEVKAPRWSLIDRPSQIERQRQHRAEAAKLLAERRELDERLQAELAEITDGSGNNQLEFALKSATDPGARAWHQEALQKMADKAREADNRAQRRGELAAAIYDHEPSQAFTEAYTFEELDISDPECLYFIESDVIPDLEEQAADLRNEIDDFEDHPVDGLEDFMLSIEEFFDKYLKQEAKGTAFQEYSEEHDLEDLGEQMLIEYNRLMKDDTTVREIKLVPANMRKFLLQFVESQIALFKQVVADVESGKAQDTDYKRPEHLSEEKRKAITLEGDRHRRHAQEWLDIAEGREGEDREKALRIAETSAQRAEEYVVSDAVQQPNNATPESQEAPITEAST